MWHHLVLALAHVSTLIQLVLTEQPSHARGLAMGEDGETPSRRGHGKSGICHSRAARINSPDQWGRSVPWGARQHWQKKAQQRGLKLQALNKDEDSAG